jgi:hypothetical protein
VTVRLGAKLEEHSASLMILTRVANGDHVSIASLMVRD